MFDKEAKRLSAAIGLSTFVRGSICSLQLEYYGCEGVRMNIRVPKSNSHGRATDAIHAGEPAARPG